MRVFGEPQAEYYCRQYVVSGSLGSYRKYAAGLPNHTLVEGTPNFNEYRSQALQEAERCLFLAASCYRRCLDLMTAAASPWALVTAYYGSWFAASALMHMFGIAVLDRRIVEVASSTPGQQRLIVRSIGTQPGQVYLPNVGPHRRFWYVFYQSTPQLIPLVGPHVQFVLAPVNGNEFWLIDNRNDTNYDTWDGFDLAKEFQSTFLEASFPRTLPAGLDRQYTVLEGLLEISFGYADRFSLNTSAIAHHLGKPTLKKAINDLIYSQKAPALVRKSSKATVASRV